MLLILDLIHYRLYQADSQSAFPLFMHKVSEIRFGELIDIKRISVVNYFKDDRFALFSG